MCEFPNTRAGCHNPNDSGVGDFVLDLELGLQTAEAGSESKQGETNRKPEQEREPRSKKGTLIKTLCAFRESRDMGFETCRLDQYFLTATGYCFLSHLLKVYLS